MNPARILIVDDNPVNLKLAASVLEFEGYRILEAVDASQALQVIRQTPPDFILMDIALPGMDGLALTRQLKADPATRHIRIAALTGLCHEGRRSKREGVPAATATLPNPSTHSQAARSEWRAEITRTA